MLSTSSQKRKFKGTKEMKHIHNHILPFCIGKGKLQSGVNRATRQRISKTLEAILFSSSIFSLCVYLFNDFVPSYIGIYMLLELDAKYWYFSGTWDIAMFVKEGGGISSNIKADENLRYCETILEPLSQHLLKKRNIKVNALD